MVSPTRIMQPDSHYTLCGNEQEAQSADAPPRCLHGEIIELESYRQGQPASDRHLNEIVYFPITVDESFIADAQIIVKRSCGDSVNSIEVEPLLARHQSKIWIRMKAAAYGIALHAIILGIPAAELGQVTHVPAILQD